MIDTPMSIIMPLGMGGLIGAVFIIMAVALVNSRKKKETRCTAKTHGKVIDIVKHQNYDRKGQPYNATWHAVFEYTIGELKFIKESSYGSSHLDCAIGQEIEVYYNPEDYDEYYVPGNSFPKSAIITMVLAGIFAIIIGVIVAIAMSQLQQDFILINTAF